METGVCIFVDEAIDFSELLAILAERPAFIVAGAESYEIMAKERITFIGERAREKNIPFFVFAYLEKTGKTRDMVKAITRFVSDVSAEGVFIRTAAGSEKRLDDYITALRGENPGMKVALCISSFAVLSHLQVPIDEIYVMFVLSHYAEEIVAGWKRLRNLKPNIPAYPIFIPDHSNKDRSDITNIANSLGVTKFLLWSISQFLSFSRPPAVAIHTYSEQERIPEVTSLRYEVFYDKLAKAREPGFESEVIGWLRKGIKVTVVELKMVGKNLFGRLQAEEKEWVLIRTSSAEFMKITGE